MKQVKKPVKKMVPDYEKYAKLRDAREMTDYQVGCATTISTATLSSWKSGIYRPKIDKMMRIANLFNVSVEFLMKEVEE